MASTALPLAQPINGERGGEPHRVIIGLPEPARANPERFAVAALAALIHRYTNDTEIAVGVADGAVELTVTGDRTVGDLIAAVAATKPRAAQAPHAAVSTADWGAAALTLSPGKDKFELLVSQVEFDADAAAQYGRHVEQLLTGLAGDPTVPLANLALLTEEETSRTLFDWNANDATIAASYFHELVAGYARTTPDAVAVSSPNSQVTYRELDDAANQLAHRLRAIGVRPRDRVGVCFPRGADSIIAQLACFKLAVGVILLDPDFPADRVRFMIADADAAAVLTLKAHESTVDGICRVLSLDVDDWRAEPTAEVAEPVTADDIIHVGYTSGSTGTPKAVLARFGSCRNLIHSMRELCELTPESNGTWLAAPGYGMIQVECFPVLAAGATVHIPEIAVVASAERLQDWILAAGINSTLLMKPMAERLWRLDWPADTPLRNIRVCGERIQTWPPADLPFRLINVYGSTEATTVASCDITSLGEQLGADGRARRLPPIGKPIANVKTYVLDAALRPVPPGVIGELCISGDGLSAGYLNQPEQTAKRWVPNPIDPARSPILYRTGDMARYWPDGSIELVGRTDNQIKVRGNTVQLGEIEVALAALSGVSLAAVLAQKDGHGDTQLTAYIEPEDGATPSIREIRAGLAERLPSFMVPAAYVIGTFTTARNGKIDRDALPEPPRSRPDLDTPYQAPRNDIERSLLELLAEGLELDGLGVLDNFFEIGGDSLRAARLIQGIRDRFEVDVDLGDLFTEPTVAHMASVVQLTIAA